MSPWSWLPCGRPKNEPSEPRDIPQHPSEKPESQPSPAQAPPAAFSRESPPNLAGVDTGTQKSTITVDSPMPSGRPGQAANPISLVSQNPNPPLRDTPKAVPGPSYESDDEGDGAATVEERLNDITKSVKSHANALGGAALNEAAWRQADEVAAKRLVVERSTPHDREAVQAAIAAAAGVTPEGSAAATGGGPAAATAPGPVPTKPDATPAPGAAGSQGSKPDGAPAQAQAAAGEAAGNGAAGEGSAQQPSNGECEIDLDIELTKGHLKVDYSTRGLLGQGGFAAVYKGRYKGQRVAVKMIKKTAGSTLADLQEDMNALMHELHILRQVNHPNIVTLYGGCLKPPHIFLVEERMEGTLDFYVHQVRKHDALSVREVVYFALDVACGLSYLHPRIVHRDLKPANVLLSREGRCKISDFGLARTKIKEYLSTKNLDAGTTAYIAPECFMSMDNPDIHDLRRSVTDRTDIYALGIIMWEMLAGKRPWQGLKPLLVAYQVAYRSLRPPLFELGHRCPARLRQLIEDCWCQEPKQRPSSQQVVDRLIEILNELPAEQDYSVYPAAAGQSQAQPQAGADPQAAKPGPAQAAVPQVVPIQDAIIHL